ncbi:MAG: methyltransferase [Bacteroidota bacterium]
MKIMDNNYWSNLYTNEEAGWDVGNITPPLKGYFDQLTDKNISILIPGCGNSYEAEYLLQNGFTNITLIDISSVLCEQLKQRLANYLSKGLQIICGDFFEQQGQYDLIVEQTFFCALDPSLRKSYAEKMQVLLKPGGKLVGVLFNRQFDSSSPFGGDENEYRNLFEKHFTIEMMEPCYNSIKPRAGAELFVKFTSKQLE